MRSVAIIPAAGASVRMGFPKLLARIDGKTLIEVAIAKASLAGCEAVIVVVGGGPREIANIAESCGAAVVENPAWREGLGASIAMGAKALPADADVALILPADQIGVEESHLRSLIAWVRENGGVAATVHGERKGAPAAFRRESFHLLTSLTGDRGAQEAIQQARGFSPPRPIRDLDTPADLAHAGAQSS